MNKYLHGILWSFGIGSNCLTFSLPAVEAADSSSQSIPKVPVTVQTAPNQNKEENSNEKKLASNGTAVQVVTTPATSSSKEAAKETAKDEQNPWAAWMIEGGQAAKDYVDDLDKGRYAEAWTKGDPIFQRTITQQEWVTALNLARKRLGNVHSRILKDQRPAMDPHGLPKGPYMVVEYDTSFERAPNSGELLTLRLGTDGKWHVLTYQVN
ncbi:DUF4019 domain-containing protein [Candidatus Protochlamydia phocaeensis]|uniref:DUF4019 domain-containing protein n=1 Tax=Candidatus Protochlamydia phocaeensis TaxID=1414722 RepID=UPI000837AADC|nr:DUF4019 domain-containing protein [Candidatus Protochlamydia phocaeensis]